MRGGRVRIERDRAADRQSGAGPVAAEIQERRRREVKPHRLLLGELLEQVLGVLQLTRVAHRLSQHDERLPRGGGPLKDRLSLTPGLRPQAEGRHQLRPLDARAQVAGCQWRQSREVGHRPHRRAPVMPDGCQPLDGRDVIGEFLQHSLVFDSRPLVIARLLVLGGALQMAEPLALRRAAGEQQGHQGNGKGLDAG